MTENTNTQPIRIAQLLGKMSGGGVEQVVMNYYRAIDHSRVQFDFFAFKNSAHIPAEEIKSMGGGLYLLCGFNRPFRYVKTLSKLLKDGGYTIAHCHLNTLSLLPLLAAKRAGIPVRIIHNHSTSGGRREWLRNFMKALLKPFAGKYATHRLACSEYAARWLFKNAPVCELDDEKAPRAAVRILHNAIDTERFAFSEKKRSKLRGEFRIPSGTLLFAHIGRFCPQKNQSYLIGVFKEIHAKHPNSRLMLVGEGADMQLIRAQALAAGVGDKVVLTGRREDADYVYSAADCFLLPSNYEGLALCGVEAQCAGLFCLFSDRISPETKITPNAQFLPLGSAEDWAFAALGCAKLHSRNTAQLVRDAGYDINEQAKKLADYYAFLVKTTKNSADC